MDGLVDNAVWNQMKRLDGNVVVGTRTLCTRKERKGDTAEKSISITLSLREFFRYKVCTARAST